MAVSQKTPGRGCGNQPGGCIRSPCNIRWKFFSFLNSSLTEQSEKEMCKKNKVDFYKNLLHSSLWGRCRSAIHFSLLQPSVTLSRFHLSTLLSPSSLLKATRNKPESKQFYCSLVSLIVMRRGLCRFSVSLPDKTYFKVNGPQNRNMCQWRRLSGTSSQ